MLEALHFLLTSRGLSDGEANCVQLALQAQLVEMVANDLMYELPDENGRRVCEMALSSFSDASVRVAADISAEAAAATTAANKTAETFPDEKSHAAVTFAVEVPEATRARVLQLGADLSTCAEDVESLPPHLISQVCATILYSLRYPHKAPTRMTPLLQLKAQTLLSCNFVTT